MMSLMPSGMSTSSRASHLSSLKDTERTLFLLLCFSILTEMAQPLRASRKLTLMAHELQVLVRTVSSTLLGLLVWMVVLLDMFPLYALGFTLNYILARCVRGLPGASLPLSRPPFDFLF